MQKFEDFEMEFSKSFTKNYLGTKLEAKIIIFIAHFVSDINMDPWTPSRKFSYSKKLIFQNSSIVCLAPKALLHSWWVYT